MHVHMLHMPKSGTGFMHGSGQLSASLVSLLILILVVFVCIFHFCITCFVAEIKLSYLILLFAAPFTCFLTHSHWT